jgi:hypothetical protein
LNTQPQTLPFDDSNKAVAAFRAALHMDVDRLPGHENLTALLSRALVVVPLTVEDHRARLKRLPTHLDSLHSLFRHWTSAKQNDRAFCAAGVLTFLRSADAAEKTFYAEGCSWLAQEPKGRLGKPELAALMHPEARNALSELLRTIGDQLSTLYPARFDLLGVDPRADRLKPDGALFRAVHSVVQVFGADDFDVYQARRPRVDLETTSPLSICVGHDLARKYNLREQKYLFGRAALGLVNKTAVLRKVSATEAADLFGNTVRIHQPDYAGLGSRNDAASKQLRRAYSYLTVRAIKAPSRVIAQGEPLDVAGTLDALGWSADRAGLTVCGDVASALDMLFHDDPSTAGLHPVGAAQVFAAVSKRRDLRELLDFALSDDFFHLRAKLGMTVA